jgi:hypothetical protein
MTKHNHADRDRPERDSHQRQSSGDSEEQTRHSSAAQPGTGISNRESAADEAAERREHPPVDTSSPPPEDAGGRTGEQPLDDLRDRHTSHKAGSRSIAQKEDEARYPDRSMPASSKVARAFGREPQPDADDPSVVRRATRE